MKQIRQNAFETNSSSTHSISIVYNEYKPDYLPVDGDGVCRIHCGGFGWEIENYHDAPTKAAYCLTWLKTVSQYNVDASFIEKNEKMFIDVIKKHTTASDVEFVPHDDNDDYFTWGYIDHQSIEYNGGVGAEAFENETALTHFIFNRNSVLHTDNDNH